MNIVCALFRYFPFGGMSRDMMRISNALAARGHRVTICAERWEGNLPAQHRVCLFPSKKMTNHGRAAAFACSLKHYIDTVHPDVVIGFNRMPYLDAYFAADVCYAEAVEENYHGIRGLIYKHLPRGRTFLDFEKAVFGANSKTRIMFLDESQRRSYQKFYKLDEDRYLVLPPAINPDCRYGRYTESGLRQCRHAWSVSDHELLFLQVGSDFKRKGLDRSIRAIAVLPDHLKAFSKLVVVGKDNELPFRALAAELKIDDRVVFTQGILDASMLISAADVLIHPARRENTGTVIVEALVAGTPVITTANCGFSHYVKESMGGIVVAEQGANAFEQRELDEEVRRFASDLSHRNRCIEAATNFARSLDMPDIYETAVNYLTHL